MSFTLTPPTDIENPIIFEERAQNGTPRMKMDLVRERYPKLFSKIMENFQQGKPFEIGEISYKVQTSDQYGNTVYQNKKKGGRSSNANNQELITAIKDQITAINNNTLEIIHLSKLLAGRNQ